MRQRQLAIATIFLGMLCGGFAAVAADNSFDIAVIDRALSTAKPTDPYVKFGDVGIKYADLKVYRDRLAGSSSTPRRQSVNPQAVTPAGTTFKWPSAPVSALQSEASRDGGNLCAPSAVGAAARNSRSERDVNQALLPTDARALGNVG